MPNTAIDYTRILRYNLNIPNPIDYDLLNINNKTGKVTPYLGGLARFIKDHHIIYHKNQFYQFDGCVYKPIYEEDLKSMMHRAIDICTNAVGLKDEVLHSTEKTDVIDKLKSICALDLVDWGDQDMSEYKSIDDQEDMFEAEEDTRGEYDHLIAFNNGLYNIQTDKLLPFTPGIFITHKRRANYDPTINSCPEAEAIFETMIPDKDTRNCFYQMVGYSLFANRITGKDAAIFIMYGAGANGKGTIQEIMTRIMGEDVISSLDIGQVTTKFTSNVLDGKLVNFCSDTSTESSSQTKIDMGILKQLATGEPVTVREIYGKPYKMHNCAKLWFMANSIPDLGGVDGGLIRRLHVIHLTHIFGENDDIQSVLYTRKAVQWFTYTTLMAYVEFLALNSRFQDSESMLTERNYYTLINNIYDYLYNNYSTDRTELQELFRGRNTTSTYNEYKMYCLDNGLKPMSNRRFLLTLRTDFNLGSRKENILNDLGGRSSVMVFDIIGVKGAK